jgi:hypothetical protein
MDSTPTKSEVLGINAINAKLANQVLLLIELLTLAEDKLSLAIASKDQIH